MFESEHNLRHLAFFDELGSRNEISADWKAAMAGLVVLRLVDAWIEDGPRVVAADDFGMRAVRRAVDEIEGNEKLRSILSAILDVLESSTVVDMGTLAPRLMAYGQLLEYDAKWTLAGDVYTSLLGHTHPVQEAELASHAHLRLGFCLRQLGDLTASVTAYRTAGEIARRANDMVGMLRARIGEAKAAMSRGNMPDARNILDETIAEADRNNLTQVKSMALHDRAMVAHLTGDFELAIELAYQAFETSESPRDRDRLLGDIASSFKMLGVRSAARDAYLILASTAVEQYSRWFATLSLMEIAADDGEEVLFEQYRRAIEPSVLPPQLRVQYWLSAGVGYDRLTRYDVAETFLRRAMTIAEENDLHQLAFEAETALQLCGPAFRRMRAEPDAFVENERLHRVAGVLQEHRELIGR